MAFGLFVSKYLCPGVTVSGEFLLPRFDGAIVDRNGEWVKGNQVIELNNLIIIIFAIHYNY